MGPLVEKHLAGGPDAGVLELLDMVRSVVATRRPGRPGLDARRRCRGEESREQRDSEEESPCAAVEGTAGRRLTLGGHDPIVSAGEPPAYRPTGRNAQYIRPSAAYPGFRSRQAQPRQSMATIR